MTLLNDTWQRIEAAHTAAGTGQQTTVAERDQTDALAADLERELQRSPVVHAWQTDNGHQLMFWCKFCTTHHFHGRHTGSDASDARGPRAGSVLPLRLWRGYLKRLRTCLYDPHCRGQRRAACTCPPGSGDGHREAHCWNRDPGPYYRRGYILREVEPNDARATRKPARAAAARRDGR